jgi:hypothetical protein
MGRRAKPAKGKAESKRSRSGKSPKNEGSRVRDLERRLAESLEREKATGEILRVIGSSPSDVQPVFELIAERAMRLCGAPHGGVLRFDGELIHLAAHVDISPEFGETRSSGRPCGADIRDRPTEAHPAPGPSSPARSFTSLTSKRIPNTRGRRGRPDFGAPWPCPC